MRLFNVSVTFSRPYPVTKTYQVEATGIPAAVGKAIRRWRKEEVKGKRIKEATIKILTA